MPSRLTPLGVGFNDFPLSRSFGRELQQASQLPLGSRVGGAPRLGSRIDSKFVALAVFPPLEHTRLPALAVRLGENPVTATAQFKL